MEALALHRRVKAAGHDEAGVAHLANGVERPDDHTARTTHGADQSKLHTLQDLTVTNQGENPWGVIATMARDAAWIVGGTSVDRLRVPLESHAVGESRSVPADPGAGSAAFIGFRLRGVAEFATIEADAVGE